MKNFKGINWEKNVRPVMSAHICVDAIVTRYLTFEPEKFIQGHHPTTASFCFERRIYTFCQRHETVWC